MTQPRRSFLGRREYLEHVLAAPSDPTSIIDVKAFDLVGFSFEVGTILVSGSFSFDVSADNGASFQRLQVVDANGATSDYTVIPSLAGRAIVLPFETFAPWRFIKILPSSAGDYGKILNLALRYCG